MEIKQTTLVNEMHSAKMKGADAGKEASANTIAHGKEMVVWATEMLKNPHIAREIENYKGIKLETLAQRGGFAEIQARFAKGEFVAKDIHTVLTQIRNKALSQGRAQERDRGGRSR